MTAAQFHLSSVRPLIERLEVRCHFSTAEPTAAEQYMLELINRARANPTAAAATAGIDLNEGLAAGTISTDPKQPLAFNPDLISAARSHSQWMIQNDTFSHDEGSVDPGAQMTAAGYAFAGNWTWGQNIAYRGQTGGAPDVDSTVAQEENDLFVDSGIAGRGHRVNLMDDSFKEIGVGVGTGMFQGYNAVLTTQDFAAESGNSFLTGVAFTNADGSNFYSPGEGLGGITITATRASDNAVFSMTTWSAGGYSLALAPGTYTVTASGAGLGTITDNNVVMADSNVELDFMPSGGAVTPPVVATQPGWLTGTLFRDRNGDGIHEKGEGVLANWRVYADLNGDGFFERNEPSVLTNGRGVFRLKLPPGSYVIRQVVKKNFAQTTSTLGASIDADVVSGQTVTGLIFADQPIPAKKKAAALLKSLQD